MNPTPTTPRRLVTSATVALLATAAVALAPACSDSSSSGATDGAVDQAGGSGGSGGAGGAAGAGGSGGSGGAGGSAGAGGTGGSAGAGGMAGGGGKGGEGGSAGSGGTGGTAGAGGSGGTGGAAGAGGTGGTGGGGGMGATLWVGTAGSCGPLPWVDAPGASGRPMSALTGALRSFDDYLWDRGIDASEVAVLTQPCEGLCKCTAQRAVARIASSAADAAAKLGFEPLEPAPGGAVWQWLNPVQCGGNPWEKGPADPAGEATTAWRFFKDSGGVTTDWVGFAERTELFGTCAACSCPRGDRLLVLTPDRTAADLLAKTYDFRDPLP